MKIKTRRIDPVDRLRQSYDLLVEILKNPTRSGYIALALRINPGAKDPINLKLLDFKDEVDTKIKDIDRKILKVTGFDRLPGGIKGRIGKKYKI